MRIKLTLLLFLLSFSLFAQGVKVSVELVNGKYELHRDGQPYYIKGVCHSGHFLDSLPKYGGNTIRTYSVDTTKFAATTTALLDKADSLGIAVMVGLYIGHEEHGFNYNDTTAVNEQLENFRYYVKKWRDHPAVLMWAIGNEADARYTNYRLWDAVNEISEMIHEEDTLHPTTTVIASPHPEDLDGFKNRAPDVDILGVNNYRNIGTVASKLAAANITRPFMITEWGVDGTWQEVETDWNAPIEYSSTSKAYITRQRYNDYIAGDTSDQLLGSFKFIWGRQNHGEVESWFSIFNVNGESTEEAESMQYLWTGSYPAQRAPRITEMKLNGFEKTDNITVYGGAVNSAFVSAYDPNSDSLTYEWAIVEEGYQLDDAENGNSFPVIDSLITSDSTFVFNAPSKKGAYRLYVVVHDGNDKIALDGIPFQVENNEILRNYDGISVLAYESVTGGIHNGSINPDSAGVNQTSGVGKFTADGTNSYAKLVFSSPIAIEDASLFKTGDFKIKMEVRTNAPVGTDIQLNFENEASYGSYPNGRNSTYKITTTKQNDWESLSFNYNSTPAAVSDLEVDQFTFTFDPGNSSSYTYYFDNIRIERIEPEVLGGGDVFIDYENSPLISYDTSNGIYNVIENTFPGGSNLTDTTSVYVRSSATYDALKFTNQVIDDASVYESGEKEIAIDIYTAAPLGTVLEIQLRNTSMVGNYPDGRHSIYRTKVLEQNNWYRARFKYVESPDSSVPDDSVDQMIFFLSPGVVSNDTFYIDNIRDITVNEEIPVLPSPWENSDIGSVGITGSASATTNGSLFTILGSGANIWGTNDEFQYVYQPFSGDGEIICMVQSISPDVDDYVKAGVMFRETLDDDSKNALMYVTPESGNAFQYRTTTSSSTSKVSDASTLDRWLKLERTGNVFEAYQSNDGVNWSFVSSQTITMADDIYIGLAVTSHDDTQIATSKFRDVSIIPAYSSEIQNNETSSTSISSISEIRAFPNPVTNILYLKSINSKIVDTKVYNFNAKLLVKDFNLDGDMVSLDMSLLNKGLYILKVKLANNQIISKLIAKK